MSLTHTKFNTIYSTHTKFVFLNTASGWGSHPGAEGRYKASARAVPAGKAVPGNEKLLTAPIPVHPQFALLPASAFSKTVRNTAEVDPVVR